MYRIFASLICVAMLMLTAASFASEKKAAKAPEGMKELKPEFPRALFIGTPKNIRSANLEKPRKGPPPPIFALKDTKLISEDKTVSASDEEPIIGEIEMVTDADLEGTDGSFVELGPGKQYVQIDLESKFQIDCVWVWHYHSEARVYHDVVVQTADDEDFITNVKTVFNNDHDNSLGKGIGKDKEYIETNRGRAILPKKVTGRYVRLYSNGSTSSEMNHYIETQVYGRKAK